MDGQDGAGRFPYDVQGQNSGLGTGTKEKTVAMGRPCREAQGHEVVDPHGFLGAFQARFTPRWPAGDAVGRQRCEIRTQPRL